MKHNVRTKHVCFLLADGILKPSSLFGAIEIFEKANEFFTDRGEEPFYEIQIVGADISQNLLNTSFSINAIKDLKAVQKTDCIIIPGFEGNDDFAIRKSSRAISWLIEQYKDGAEIASLCTGSFLLAATGLLKGMECSTHWKAEEVFRKMFPDLKLCTDKVITDNKGLYTAGGALSCLNLVLYLVEKYNGRETALYCSKVLQIEIERNSQSPFIIFKGLKDHRDKEIIAVQDYIENNIEEKITVDFLAGRQAMNRVNFSSRKNINEVMYSVGYADVKAFRSIFKKIAGITPMEYRLKFSTI